MPPTLMRELQLTAGREGEHLCMLDDRHPGPPSLRGDPEP